MEDQTDLTRTGEVTRKNVNRLGFWTAVLITVFTIAALALGITTPPRSGPFCVGPCITHPYTDAASFVPRDYFWMYPAFFLGALFVVLMACIHLHASEDKKIFSQIGLIFASISAAVLTIDYTIQLVVMQPSFLKGEIEHLSLFSQYNPHGIFIALEDLGYFMMSVAFFFVAAVFTRRTKLERVIRGLFFGGFILAVGSLIVLALLFGLDIEYRFECAIILIVWTVLIISGVLLSIFFKRAGRDRSS